MHLYDAQGRRRKKVYPNGKDGGFFYEGDTLLEDRGVTALLTAPGSRRMEAAGRSARCLTSTSGWAGCRWRC